MGSGATPDSPAGAALSWVVTETQQERGVLRHSQGPEPGWGVCPGASVGLRHVADAQPPNPISVAAGLRSVSVTAAEECFLLCMYHYLADNTPH